MKIYHGQHAATTNAGYIDHLKKTLNGIKKKVGKKPNISNRLYPTGTPVTAVIMIKIGK